MPESDIDKTPQRTRLYGVVLASVVAIGSLALVALTHEPKKAVSSPTPTTPPPKTVQVPQMAGAKSDAEILFRGKSFSLIRRKIVLPFTGEITKVTVEEGQIVNKDQPLAEYNLDREARLHVQKVLYPETVLNLKKTMVDQQVELDKLTGATLPVRKSEEARLEKEAADLRQLLSRGLASAEALANKERDLDAVKDYVKEIQQSIKQVKYALTKTQEDLKYYEEKQKRDLDLLEWQTGRMYNSDGLPLEKAVIKAPIGGQVIWIATELSERAELSKGFDVINVAAKAPVVVRCKVHELELVRLKNGDRGTVTFDAMPAKKYACKVTRIPWVSRNAALDVPADYEIECLLEAPDERIKDGLTCNVKIHVAQ